MDNLGCLAFSAHLKLARNINKDLWSIIDARATLKAINEGHIAQKRQYKKLSNLFKCGKLNNAIENSTDLEGSSSMRINSNDNILSHCSSSSDRAKFRTIDLDKGTTHNKQIHAKKTHYVGSLYQVLMLPADKTQGTWS